MRKYCISIFHILILLLLYSCKEPCIDADDFGHAKVSISSRYDANEFTGQSPQKHVASWVDSNYILNGKTLTMVVKGWDNGIDHNNSSELSAWCPWYGSESDKNRLSDFVTRFRDCQFYNNNMCPENSIYGHVHIVNAPCIFRNGIGLYALLSNKTQNPNQNIRSKQNPKGINFHLGSQRNNYSLYDINRNGDIRNAGGAVYNYLNPQEQAKYHGGNLYFKILDNFYNDNSGQYIVTIKSGIERYSSDPISWLTNLVRDFLFGTEHNTLSNQSSNNNNTNIITHGIAQQIYLGVVQNPAYKYALSALLTLYVVYSALSYLSGNLAINQNELIIRVIKIAIITALMSEYSWSFFNEYLFVFFVGGVEEILRIITNATTLGSGDGNILGLMIAPQTLAKLGSLFFANPESKGLAILYIILFAVIIFMTALLLMHATIIYLTALIMVSMIIVMAPIFITFMLFDFTKPLFDNWLKHLISYAIQPIILFAGIAMISLLIQQEIYGSLGFTVCKYSLVKDTDFDKIPLYVWSPMQKNGSDFSRETHNIPIPIAHLNTKDGTFCNAYECIGPRYVDLPFLDPATDMKRIEKFWNGQFLQFDRLFLIIVSLYLLYCFNKGVISIAQAISGSFSQIELDSVAAAGTKAGFEASKAGAKALLKAGLSSRAGISSLKQSEPSQLNETKYPVKGTILAETKLDDIVSSNAQEAPQQQNNTIKNDAPPALPRRSSSNVPPSLPSSPMPELSDADKKANKTITDMEKNDAPPTSKAPDLPEHLKNNKPKLELPPRPAQELDDVLPPKLSEVMNDHELLKQSIEDYNKNHEKENTQPDKASVKNNKPKKH